MRSKIAVLSLITLVSCSGSGDDAASVTSDSAGSTATATTMPTGTTGASSTSTATQGTASETTMSMDGAPFFISFSTNVAQITDGESVIFTAIVSDPDGFGDIAGGTLFTQDGKFWVS